MTDKFALPLLSDSVMKSTADRLSDSSELRCCLKISFIQYTRFQVHRPRISRNLRSSRASSQAYSVPRARYLTVPIRKPSNSPDFECLWNNALSSSDPFRPFRTMLSCAGVGSRRSSMTASCSARWPSWQFFE